MRNVIHFQDRDGQIARVWKYSGRRNSFVKFTDRDVHIDQDGRLFRWKEYKNTLGWIVKNDYAVQLWNREILTFRSELALGEYLNSQGAKCLGAECRESTALQTGSVGNQVVLNYWNRVIIVNQLLENQAQRSAPIGVQPVQQQTSGLTYGETPPTLQPVVEAEYDLGSVDASPWGKPSVEEAETVENDREVIIPFDQAIQVVLCTRLNEHIKFVFDWYEKFDSYDELKFRVLSSHSAKNETQKHYFIIGLVLLNGVRLVNNVLHRLGMRPRVMP